MSTGLLWAHAAWPSDAKGAKARLTPEEIRLAAERAAARACQPGNVTTTLDWLENWRPGDYEDACDAACDLLGVGDDPFDHESHSEWAPVVERVLIEVLKDTICEVADEPTGYANGRVFLAEESSGDCSPLLEAMILLANFGVLDHLAPKVVVFDSHDEWVLHNRLLEEPLAAALMGEGPLAKSLAEKFCPGLLEGDE